MAPRLTVTLGFAAALLVGCGGGSPDSTAKSTSPGQSGTTTPAGCMPPASAIKYLSGAATVNITGGALGPQSYTLSLDPAFDKNSYNADKKELHARWVDQAGHALEIDIEGSDPCKPDAFTRIETGPSGPAFVDSVHNLCHLSLPTLSAQNALGTFLCTKLGGGGQGVTIDANGTFALSA